MSKRQFKSQASSSRATTGAGFGGFAGFGSGFAGSALSYLSEPPNLSLITDANVVVSFKNLSKKDSTTKTKGLEDLRSFVQAHPYDQNGGVEQPFLDAWVKVYPRISIDNSRRVRELSHNLQYELLRSARKRMEKHIPLFVGAWLAGTFDRDRPVSRAANDGITSFLDTDDKILAFWRKCQPQILQYAQDAMQETPQTLSDERVVSADDIQDKYDRVIGASLNLVVNLLNKLNDQDIKRYQESYESFLSGNKTLWGFVSSKNIHVRISTAQLLRVALDKQTAIIETDLEIISSAFIAEGLRSSQMGTSLALLHALIRLTIAFPQVWTTAYKSKKSSLSRLRYFVQKGSQSGAAEFWKALGALVLKLPTGVLPEDFAGAADFLVAYRDGIAARGEVRTNAGPAWDSYLLIVQHLTEKFVDTEIREKFVATAIFPLFQQFLRPASENSGWSVGASGTPTLAKAFQLCSQPEYHATASLGKEWQRLSGLLTSSMLTSLPEQAKDYAKSQDGVVAEGLRWFSLYHEILNQEDSAISSSYLVEPSCSLIKHAIQVLTNRNGKPYGAAGIVEAALRLTPELINSSSIVQNDLARFFNENFSSLIMSPSSSYLISSLNAFGSMPRQEPTYESVWQQAVGRVLSAPSSAQKTKAIQSLISHESAAIIAQRNITLQNYLVQAARLALHSDGEAWELVKTAITYHVFGDDGVRDTVEDIVNGLSIVGSDTTSSLQALEFLAQSRPEVLHDGELQIALMTRLLALGEESDTQVSARASALKVLIETGNAASPSVQGFSPVVQIIRENLEFASPQSLSIDILVTQARAALKDVAIVDIFPKVQTWADAIQPLLTQKPNPALSLTNCLNGAVLLVQLPVGSLPLNFQRDLDGFSPAFRMALYTSRLLSDYQAFRNLDLGVQVDLLHLLLVMVEIVGDQLGLQSEDMLWSSLSDPELENQVQDFLSDTQKSLVAILRDSPEWRGTSTAAQTDLAQNLLSRLLRTSYGTSLSSFYTARASCKVLANLVELHGWQTAGAEEWLSSLDILNPSTVNTITATAVIYGLKDVLSSSKIVNNLCNRLISEVSGAQSTSEKTLGTLVYLNACLDIYESDDLPAAQTRLVFAVKQIVSWMIAPSSLTSGVASEACRSLLSIFPSIEGVYGSHWQTALDFCVYLWTDRVGIESFDERLSAIYSSMKLRNLLEKLLHGSEDKNDDLEEALITRAPQLHEGLVQLLRLPRERETQPCRIVDELLCRELTKLPIAEIKEPFELYPLIASDFRSIQSAAFDLLHRLALTSAEEISVQVLLDKIDARLPDELLSLLLDPPSSLNVSDEDLVRFPAPIRSYLLSWQLVYDSYTNASYKVRNDYSEILKSGAYLSPLLDFTADVLGLSAGHSINLEKARLTNEHVRNYNYISAAAETDEFEMQWLLINLFYQSLKYTPNLVKNWWIDCRSKQTRIAVEAWTERNFSPLVISDTLEDVVKWSAEQDSTSDEEKDLIIKVSRKSREVYAGYEVDDMQMQIVIRLPATYPLEGVKVEGVNRVAATEKKWQSWLMITQGVITFSNGSITDGLAIFRKNVTGALKGQTECAICYSIISSDKKMPDKRCQTCKNLFHSSCLFKWFASSNQSTCPLCRNPFNYGTDPTSRARARRAEMD